MKIFHYIVIFFLIGGCTQKAAKEKFRIPYGFKGQVLIFFNIKDGAEKKYENGYRIYDIPETGILKTKFPPTYGYQKKGEYLYVYVDKLNKEYILEGERSDSNKVYITAKETGGEGMDDEIIYLTFNVKSDKEEIILVNRNSKKMDSVLRKVGLK